MMTLLTANAPNVVALALECLLPNYPISTRLLYHTRDVIQTPHDMIYLIDLHVAK